MEKEAKVQKLWTIAEAAKSLYDVEFKYVLANYVDGKGTPEENFAAETPEDYARWKALGDALKALHDGE
jgi:aminoglycoside phosphotransferase (APT) family kinase protein